MTVLCVGCGIEQTVKGSILDHVCPFCGGRCFSWNDYATFGGVAAKGQRRKSAKPEPVRK